MKTFRTLLLGLLLVSLGCSGKPSISGLVTYEGEPISNGVISFSPVDGNATPVACKIRDGKFRVEEAFAGSMKVTVSGYEIPEAPAGSNKPVYTKEIVPYNAKGNMQTVEVTSGAQSMEFHLTAPER